MRNTLLLIFITVLQAHANDTYSQNTKLTLNFNSIPVANVLEEIQNKSEFYFLFNAKLIDVEREVSISMDDMKISEILTSLFSGTGVHYLVYDRQIILTPSDVTSLSAAMQQQKITGTVTTKDGTPLAGVNVVVTGTTVGTMTDVAGKYSIVVPQGSKSLTFSFIGMVAQEITIGTLTQINVTLVESAIGLEEVVVVGYGTARKKDLTGSVVSVNPKLIETQPAGNFSEYLRGRVAGFNTTLTNGAKDQLNNMEIRGPASIKANNTPLIVMDGMIYNGDVADINPRDIESMEVLKDASSAAIFGARSAAGVVLITTKKGSGAKPTVTLSSSFGISAVANLQAVRSPEGYLNEKMWYMKGLATSASKPSGYFDNPSSLPSGVTVDQWRAYSTQPSTQSDEEIWAGRIALTASEIKNYLTGNVIDWEKEIFQTAFRQDHTISVSGSTSNTKYYTSIGYVDNKGIVFGDTYNNVRTRLNLETVVTDWFKVGVNAQYANRDESGVPIDWTRYFYYTPYADFKNEDGSYKLSLWDDNEGSTLRNTWLTRATEYYKKRKNLTANLFGIITFAKGLTFQTNYSNSLRWSQDYQFEPSSTGLLGIVKGRASRIDYTAYEYTIDNILKWNRQIDKHRFDATLLYSVEKYQDWSTTGTGSDFPGMESLSYHALNYAKVQASSSTDRYRTGDAIMGRLNYSWSDKYFFTGSVRRDGYSEFGANNPYAWFPSAGLGWLITEEDFCDISWLNTLKLRASYGVNGNRDIAWYAALADLTSIQYNYDGTSVIGVTTNKMANNDLKWEQTASTNIAVDFSVLKSRISGTIDMYKMKTTDLLITRTLPSVTGYSSVWSNLGELQNKGLEITINTENIKNKDISWNSNLGFYFNRNKIVHLFGNMVDVKDASGAVIGQKEADDETNKWYIGHGIDEIYDYKVIGVWQLGEETEAAKYGKLPGDFKLLDVNGDGKLLPENDRMFLGNSRPRFRTSLINTINFKDRLELSFMLSGQFGFMGDSYWHKHDSYTYGRTNHYDYPYWTTENPTNDNARVYSNASSPGFGYYVSKSFVRMENINLSYNFNKNLIAPLQLSTLRAYINISNAFLLTNWDLQDPETVSPLPRTFTFGLNVSF